MEDEVRIGEGGRLGAHPLRRAVLGEVHARPFSPITAPSRLLHFGFETDSEQAQADRASLTAFCAARGVPAPQPGARHHRVALGALALRWEQHSEFTTYTWELSGAAAQPFSPSAAELAVVAGELPAPGPVLVAVDLHLFAGDPPVLPGVFDRASLAAAQTADGRALCATDFLPDAGGFVRILVHDRGLGAEGAGALVQRLLELETYRTLALLGLPQAQRLQPSIRRIEERLAQLTEAMRRAEGLADNRRLLDALTALAAELEADAAASQFRFGASRAYDEIVQARLRTLGEQPVGEWPTWSQFLARRLTPAMRTCVATAERQASLSRRLARAADLLRTRVEVALQQQNQDLLRSMNVRTRLQLRLQATVEGLSVAAISYYVVGLFAYDAEGARNLGLPLNPGLATAAAVPMVALAVWRLVSRVRRRYTEEAG